MAPIGLDSRIGGGWGRNIFLPNRYYSIRYLPGLPGPGLVFVGTTRPFTSGVSGATRPRTPGFTFGRPKVNRKTAKTNGFGFLCLIGLYQNGNFSATESGFCHLIYSGSINDTPPAVRVGTSSASLILPQATGFARCAVPPSSSANAPLVCLGAAPAGPFFAGFPAQCRGYPKGALPPLCRRGGGVHRGGTPSKGSRPYAAFWLLFVRTKSDPGPGRGGPGAVKSNGSTR